MKYPLALFLILLMVMPVYGQDMRKACQKAESDHKASLYEAKDTEKRILENRRSLKKEIVRLESERKSLNEDITSMQNTFNKLEEKEKKLSLQKSKVEMEMRELTGTTRVVARDLESILKQSFFTVCFPGRIDSVEPILKKGRFPGMNDLKTISDLFFQEMTLSGEVVLRKGSFVDRSGMTTDGNILTIGKFSAAYKTGKQVGFLNYSAGGRQFFALSVLPPGSIQRNLKKYMCGKTDDVSLDFSGGAALRQITHKTTLINQIKDGGPIVWPILAIGFFALILAAERTIFLRGVHTNTDQVMGKVNELALQGKWQECDNMAKDEKERPIHNVLKAGLGARGEERETLESVLQEAILNTDFHRWLNRHSLPLIFP